MGGRPKAVEAKRSPGPGHAIAAPADEAGAQERGRFDGIELWRQRKAESRIGKDMRGIAAISRVAGEGRTVAQVFPLRTAVGASPTSRAEPWHANTLTHPASCHTRPDRRYPADDLVARH